MAGSEELSIIVRMRDFATRQFNALGGTIGKWAQAGMQKVGQFAKNLLSFHGILGMIGTAWGAMRLVDHIAQVESIDLAYGNLTKTVGGAGAVLEALRRATRGTVSDFQLMQAANRAILLGVGENAEQFETFANLARRLGRAVGRDTLDAFNDLTLGIGRQSRLILDNLGLIVKVEEANEAYAKALGVTASSLTETQKKQAFMNATMEAARKKVGDLGEDTWTMADAWGALKATLGNIANDILTQTLPVFTELFTSLKSGLAGSKQAITGFIAEVVDVAARIVDEVAPAFRTLADIWSSMQSFAPEYTAYMSEATKKAIEAKGKAGDSLRQLAKDLRLVGRADLEFYRNALKVLGAFKDEVKAIWGSGELGKRFAEAENFFKAFQRYSYQPIDVSGSRAAALEEEIAGYVKLSKEMERVQEIRAKFDFAPPLIEAPTEQFTYKYRQQFTWMQKAYAELERTDMTAGAAKGFTELRDRAQEWGKTTYEWVMNVSGAISTNLADAIVEIGFNFKEAGQIAKEFTIQLLKDLARITMQLAMMQAVQAGMGALGGALGLGGSQMQPFSFHAAGGYISRPELAVVGEAGPELVRLPGGSRVYPNSELRGMGQSVNVTIHNHNPQFRTAEQERQFTRSQQEQIRAIVLQANNESTGFREGMS